VAAIDLAGKQSFLADGWNSLEGLSWSPRGDEVWFAAARSGGWPKTIYGVAPGREPRAVVRLPTSMRLVDARSDGRVLLTSVNIRSEMLGISSEEKRERNLAWLDQPLPRDFSDDGKTVLFIEQGEAMGANPAVYIRKTDGAPAVRLGEGAAQALSPDGKWALTWLLSPSTQVVLLPSGEGQPMRLAASGLTYRRDGACWLPDSRRILFQASEPQRAVRLWVQDIDGGRPHAVSPEGVALSGRPLSPDGKLAAARGPDGTLALYPLDGSASRPLSGVAPGEDIVRWSGDGRSVYVTNRSQLPTAVHRVEVNSGRRELLRTFAPADPTGVFRLGRVLLTPAGDGVVFGFTRVLSELYLVDGLR
jgi:dipeptidyl aminopeptidase/acylaminoacyl peptidase